MKVFTGFKIFCAVIFFIKTQNAFAQKTYISLNVGYNFGASPTSGYSFNYYLNNTTKDKLEVSLGKGINIDGIVGYQLTKNIGAELGVSYLLGGSTTWKYSYQIIPGHTTFVNKNYSANMLRLVPTLVFSGGYNTINPYAKIGVIIGSGSFTINQEIKEEDSVNTSTNTKKYKYEGGYAIGVYCGLGATFQLNKHFSILAEITSTNLSYAAEKSTLTEYKTDGVDILPGMSTRDKETEYVDSYQNSNTSDPNKPQKDLKQNISFSSFGFNIGVKYNF